MEYVWLKWAITCAIILIYSFSAIRWLEIESTLAKVGLLSIFSFGVVAMPVYLLLFIWS